MMYSNISEAWSHDPMKEISHQLSKSLEDNNKHAEIFNFKNHTNTINQNSIKSIPQDNLSDDNSLSLASHSYNPTYKTMFDNIDNTDNTDNTDISDVIGSYAPVTFGAGKKKKAFDRFIDDDIDYLDSDSDETVFDKKLRNSKCNYTVKHLKRCSRCYDKMKLLVNSKVQKKLDEMILDNKIKQIQNMSIPASVPPLNIAQPQPQSLTYHISTPIFIVSVIIAIILILLIIKMITK